jgi:hypothetical protein
VEVSFFVPRLLSAPQIQVSLDGKEFVALKEVEVQKKTPPLTTRKETYHTVAWQEVVLPGRVPTPPNQQEKQANSPVFPQNWPNKDELGFDNLALRDSTIAKASSSLPGYAIHKVEHLNDGKSGNSNSWVAARNPAWAEIDLGDTFWVYRVAFGNDSDGVYTDRGASKFDILVATEYNPDSKAATWTKVAPANSTSPVMARKDFCFEPVQARFVRINI